MPIQPELDFLLAYDEPDVMQDFLKHVANKGLAQYKRIAQWGEKAGEPLYTHAVNGVFTAYQLRGILQLSDTETRVLYSAYAIHDLNKVTDEKHLSFNKLANPQTIHAELENVDIPDFFPEYHAYLEDITVLIRSHSGHYHTDAEWLIPGYDPYRLPRPRLEMLRGLIKALDDLEMSSTLDERDHKMGFLKFLNANTNTQYEFVYHQVSEQRGLLTNLIHNQVKGYLVTEKELLPLLFYPEGVTYLTEKGREIVTDDFAFAAIGARVATSAANMTRGSFAKFIKAGNQGIKVDKQCLDLGIPFADIFGVIYSLVTSKIVGKRFSIGDTEEKCRKQLIAALNDLSRVDSRASLESYTSRPSLCPRTQNGMGAGELLRGYYIFLSDHFSKLIGDAWTYLYKWLAVTDEQVVIYDLFDPRYQRPFIIANDLELALDTLYERILENGRGLYSGVATHEAADSGDFTVLGDYVVQTVTFSWPYLRKSKFTSALQQYVEKNHLQCCYCGSEFETSNWMSQQVPANVTVQSYSNRLVGGSGREPKRNVCGLCRTQFILEKLNHTTAKGIKTLYLHLYPYTFFTEVFLNSLRSEMREILSQDTTVLFPKPDAIQEVIASEGKRTPLRFYTRNKQGKPYVNGLPIPPNYSDVIGNVISFPLNCPGDNDSEQFLFALQNALLLGRFFGCKVLLTDCAIPILDKIDFGDLYVDNRPLGFEGLLPTNNYGREELAGLWQDMTELLRLRALLYDAGSEQDALLPLVRCLSSDGRLELFHLADRLIERKSENIWQAVGLVKKCLPLITNIRKGDNRMKPLQTLAEMAWRDRIVGRSLERNSLLKPFDMLLDGLDARSDAFGLDTLRAQLVTDIYRHIQIIMATKGFTVGREKQNKVKAYVDAFFDGVLNGVYRGDPMRLLADAKALRSAYLFYLREQIPIKEKDSQDKE